MVSEMIGKCVKELKYFLFVSVAGDSEVTCDPHLTMENKMGLH